MKDIDRIFSSHFDKDEHGFYKIKDPIPAPSKIKPLPQLTGVQSLSIEELTTQISREVKTDIMSVKSYFPGGETEALDRLRKESFRTDGLCKYLQKAKNDVDQSDG